MPGSVVSVQLCAPGMFVERLSRLAGSAGGTIIPINPWRARLSQACHCGPIKKKARSERWHTCSCGASAQRDLFSAFLARFVHPATSLLDAGRLHKVGQPRLRAGMLSHGGNAV